MTSKRNERGSAALEAVIAIPAFLLFVALDLVLFGDIDGDGAEDAIVFLTTQSGGTGHFAELAAVLNQNGNANNASMLSLGDRDVVEAGGIQAGVITLNLRVHGPNDGLCCPSQSATFTYRLDNQQIVQLP